MSIETSKRPNKSCIISLVPQDCRYPKNPTKIQSLAIYKIFIKVGQYGKYRQNETNRHAQ